MGTYSSLLLIPQTHVSMYVASLKWEINRLFNCIRFTGEMLLKYLIYKTLTYLLSVHRLFVLIDFVEFTELSI